MTPIYVVSKGRADKQVTSRYLSQMGIHHYVVVESAELDDYERHASPLAAFLTLPSEYQAEYDTCDDLGDTKGKGPGPARNFAWDHAFSRGAGWYWVMDDNIEGWFRLNRNMKIPVADGTGFRVMEAFVKRYDNVAMAGPNYLGFVKRKDPALTPFVLNTRIYSCNLICTIAPFRWRGRYNEDTDLSLRMLKAGWCTVQFNAFLQQKVATQRVAGGNTAEFYAKEGTLPKSRMLVALHPDVARLTQKFGRDHHHVDFSRFRQQLRRRPDAVVPAGRDEFGMTLEVRDAAGAWESESRPVLPVTQR